MNQNTPNPGWSSQVVSSFEPNPLKMVRPLPPNDNPSTTVELATRSDCRQGVVMRRSCLLQMILKLTSAGEHRTETLRGDSGRADTKDRLDETRGDTTRHALSTWRCLDDGLSSGGSGGFKPWWLYWARSWVDPA